MRFGHGDFRLATKCGRDPDHRLAKGDNLAGLGEDGGHNAGDICLQFGVGALVFRKQPTLAGGLQRLGGRIGGGLSGIERSLANVPFLLEGLDALQRIGRAVRLGARGPFLRLLGAERGLEIRCVKPGDDIAASTRSPMSTSRWESFPPTRNATGASLRARMVPE
eukprot:jgi/Tetstr1/428750/TSEL_018738.t1